MGKVKKRDGNMNRCQINGCQHLETKCLDCGRVACKSTLPATPRWISVKEKLPQPFEDVLCFCYQDESNRSYEKGEGYCAIDTLCEWPDGHTTSFRTDRFYPAKVTHWMPLPDVPN